MKIIVIISSFLAVFILSVGMSTSPYVGTVRYETSSPADSSILSICEQKCNECHRDKKQVVFTSANLNDYAALIEQQVLIKARMPKGKNNQLTAAERQLIAQWVARQKKSD